MGKEIFRILWKFKKKVTFVWIAEYRTVLCWMPLFKNGYRTAKICSKIWNTKNMKFLNKMNTYRKLSESNPIIASLWSTSIWLCANERNWRRENFRNIIEGIERRPFEANDNHSNEKDEDQAVGSIQVISFALKSLKISIKKSTFSRKKITKRQKFIFIFYLNFNKSLLNMNLKYIMIILI